VPKALAELLSRCLEKDPASRPSARDLQKGLAALADERGVLPLEKLFGQHREVSLTGGR
jgi:serine/threonine protein kinase